MPVQPERRVAKCCREFAHDAGAEKALAEAKERGRTVVSMPNDVKVVFDL